MTGDPLRELQSQLALEQDPVKKQVIQEQLLDLVQQGFVDLVLMVAKEGDPDRLRVLVDQLNEIIDGRRMQPVSANARIQD